jgi:Cdc6-like AAA superfamily ATPase
MMTKLFESLTESCRHSGCPIYHTLFTMNPEGQPQQRKQPNILVTGTPGTGKTTLAGVLAVRDVYSATFARLTTLIFRETRNRSCR